MERFSLGSRTNETQMFHGPDNRGKSYEVRRRGGEAEYQQKSKNVSSAAAGHSQEGVGQVPERRSHKDRYSSASTLRSEEKGG